MSHDVFSLQINDDFIAAYQANYGFNEEGVPDPAAAIPPAESLPDKPEEPKKPEEPTKPDESSDPGKAKAEKRKADPGMPMQVQISILMNHVL